MPQDESALLAQIASLQQTLRLKDAEIEQLKANQKTNIMPPKAAASLNWNEAPSRHIDLEDDEPLSPVPPPTSGKFAKSEAPSRAYFLEEED